MHTVESPKHAWGEAALSHWKQNKVVCNYCGKSMERRNLKSHTKSVHSGQKVMEKVAEKPY
ncbi:MAG: hypothetical protein GY830_05050 [Bacteroidetes bacterium]|nr:hypothetical protein [Bacteroidota bacterium]